MKPETNVCCVCTKIKVNKLNKITENFIKIEAKFVAIREIVRQLSLIHYQLNPGDENYMKICRSCQQLVVSFYLFHLRTQRAQFGFKLPNESISSSTLVSNSGEETETPLVLHTLDIVKSFIDKHSIQSIIEDEDEQRLIIQRHISSTALTWTHEDVDDDYTQTVKKKARDSILSKEGMTMPSFLDEESAEDPRLEEQESCEDPDASDLSNLLEQPKTEAELLVSDRITPNVVFVDRTPEYILNAYKPTAKQNRPRDPDNWIRTKQRNARARGEEYVTKSGKLREAKKMQSPCKESCRYRCRTKITEEDRQKNFDIYWKLASFILQRKFIFEHHKTVPVQRRRFRSELGGKPRQYSSQYFLDKFNGDGSAERVQVCESMFLRTFDICRNIIAYLHKKVQTGKVQDLRGCSRRKLSPGHEAAIEQIKANPFYHIEQPMPITKMFALYQQECSNRGIESVKNHTYRKLFAEYNECEFLKRDKTICDVCDPFYRACEVDREALLFTYNAHIQMHEKCMQRAKGRLRFDRKMLGRKQHQQPEIGDIIVEEHLNIDDEEIEF